MIFKNEIPSHFTFHHISYCIYFQWTKCDKCDLRLKLDDEEMVKTHNIFHMSQTHMKNSHSKIEFQKGSAKISAEVSPKTISISLCGLCGENYAGLTLGMFSHKI